MLSVQPQEACVKVENVLKRSWECEMGLAF